MRWIARRLELRALPDMQREHAPNVVREVGWAVRAAAPKTPWKSACLAQAIAGKSMLARRGVRATVHLGVVKDGAGDLAAHAWLCADDIVITGGAKARKFKPVGVLE